MGHEDSLPTLVRVLPPPPVPTARTHSWDDVASTFGVRFPHGFRRLIETYGFGSVGNELMLLDPRALAAFQEWIRPSLDAMRELEPEDCENPLPPFPADGPCLLPVATNGNGDDVYVVVVDGRATEREAAGPGNAGLGRPTSMVRHHEQDCVASPAGQRGSH